jgi:hypothetical protein
MIGDKPSPPAPLPPGAGTFFAAAENPRFRAAGNPGDFFALFHDKIPATIKIRLGSY